MADGNEIKKAIIFCGGEIRNYDELSRMNFDDCLIICADGGLRHANKIGVKPHIIIGDKDSWTDDYGADAEVYVYPTKKDFTDTQLCIDYAIEHCCKEIVLLGGFGGRHDHEYSHYCLMAYALSRGVRLIMTDENNLIYMTDKPFKIRKNKYKYISFFPYGGDVEGLTLKGFEYGAENMTLKCGLVQASSNEISSDSEAEVDFKSGILMVMLCND